MEKFNQMSSDTKIKEGDISAVYDAENIYKQLDQENEDHTVDSIISEINSSKDKSFASKVLEKNDTFNIVSSIFSDLKDPLIMLFIAYVVLGSYSKRVMKENLPNLFTEAGITFAGSSMRFGAIIILFYIVRKILKNYFSN